jgi:hypothetical protein
MGEGLEPFTAPAPGPEDPLVLAAAWGREARLLKRWVMLPALVMGGLAGLGGVLLHLAGAWPVFGPSHEGRYVIWLGSVLAAATLPAAVVLTPALITRGALLHYRREAFLDDAVARGASRDELAAMARAVE